jgi:hypothetical protein
MLVPVALAALGFGVLLALVRVKVASPQFEMERQGSLVYLPATGDGLAWAIRAKEAGPSLSRYEPAAWEGYAAMEQVVIAATQVPPRPHLPQPHPLPTASGVRPPPLAPIGEPVFPNPPAAAPAPPPPVAVRLVPALYPLSPMGASELPRELPPFPGDLDPASAAANWRFLIRLHPTGGVAECLALNKTTGLDPAVLENWLRGVTFDPQLATQGSWIAVAIRFNNQPIDGTDNH